MVCSEIAEGTCAGKKGSFPLRSAQKLEAVFLPEDPQIFAYTRRLGDTEMLVCANFSDQPAACPLWKEWKDGRVLIHNYPGEYEEELKPYEAVMILL